MKKEEYIALLKEYSGKRFEVEEVKSIILIGSIPLITIIITFFIGLIFMSDDNAISFMVAALFVLTICSTYLILKKVHQHIRMLYAIRKFKKEK